MRNILIVAISVCLVCSIIVSGAAVSLKPQRLANKELDKNKNILIAAGLFEEGVTAESEVAGLFDRFEVRVADLRDHRLLTQEEAARAGIDVDSYDQRTAAKDPRLSTVLSSSEDIASISRRAHYALAYILRDEDGIERIVLPVHGYGLWSTLYGFIAVEGDGRTVAGITFYDQQETAGLGGEVANPKWKALWKGKQLYDDEGDVALHVIKGTVQPGAAHAEYQVDGLSGATLTSRGVSNLVAYWLGDEAFGPILKNLQGQG